MGRLLLVICLTAPAQEAKPRSPVLTVLLDAIGPQAVTTRAWALSQTGDFPGAFAAAQELDQRYPGREDVQALLAYTRGRVKPGGDRAGAPSMSINMDINDGAVMAGPGRAPGEVHPEAMALMKRAVAVRRGGKPRRVNFNELNISSISATDFPKVRAALSASPHRTRINIIDRQGWQAHRGQWLLLGRLIILLEGELTISVCRWSFDGVLSFLNDQLAKSWSASGKRGMSS